ncbi:MAG: aminopeptidase P family protein [Phycisphaerae bacterium]|nr:aminopeptidase P family protein [Phycisphaerae bacterium]
MTVNVARSVIDPVLVRQHLDRAGDQLAKHGVDGLFVFRDTNIRAFCGVPLAPYDRLVCGLVDQAGRLAFVAPAFEARLADGLPAGSELVTWEEHESPYAAVAEAARLLGIASGTILLDGHTWIDAQVGLSKALPRATFRPDPGVIDSVRVIKSPEDIEAIRAACEDTGGIYALISKRLRAGVSEFDLSRDVLSQLERSGLSPWGSLIQGGEAASVPHQPPSRRVFQDGDAVVVDFVCERDSYFGDMTRTFAIGRPADEVKRAYAVVRDAQKTAFEAIRQTVTCDSVDRAARSVIERAGLGEYFVHRLGHGIGLDVHEPPYLVQGNQHRLEPGMCMTIEPGVYVPGRFGIRIEDVVVVTADGYELLSNTVPTDVSPALR